MERRQFLTLMPVAGLAITATKMAQAIQVFNLKEDQYGILISALRRSEDRAYKNGSFYQTQFPIKARHRFGWNLMQQMSGTVDGRKRVLESFEAPCREWLGLLKGFDTKGAVEIKTGLLHLTKQGTIDSSLDQLGVYYEYSRLLASKGFSHGSCFLDPPAVDELAQYLCRQLGAKQVIRALAL